MCIAYKACPNIAWQHRRSTKQKQTLVAAQALILLHIAAAAACCLYKRRACATQGKRQRCICCLRRLLSTLYSTHTRIHACTLHSHSRSCSHTHANTRTLSLSHESLLKRAGTQWPQEVLTFDWVVRTEWERVRARRVRGGMTGEALLMPLAEFKCRYLPL